MARIRLAVQHRLPLNRESIMLKLRPPLAAGALLPSSPRFPTSLLRRPLRSCRVLLGFPALTCLAAPAKANVPVTYVSGKGHDSGNCSSPANPCRTFQFAVNQTAAGGEVKALDPADYRPVTTSCLEPRLWPEEETSITMPSRAVGAEPASAPTAEISQVHRVMRPEAGTRQRRAHGTRQVGFPNCGIKKRLPLFRGRRLAALPLSFKWEFSRIAPVF
jgi:hypothetical protein